MFFKKNTFHSGTTIPSHKEGTSHSPIEVATPPAEVIIPLTMHIGAPAKLLVKAGDKVCRGQKIAEANGFISSNIHSSVSGMVLGTERRFMPSGTVIEAVKIKNDFENTLAEEIVNYQKPPVASPEFIRTALLENGVVGMGGAAFPTHIKYAPPTNNIRIDTVILNGIECEPFITCDERLLIERSEAIIFGLKLFMKAAVANKGIIAIEDNKAEAIELYKKLLANERELELVVCPEKYPQGSEKHLIFSTTGRTVPNRGLPSAVGVIVDNVATAAALADAVTSNIPSIERVVTVSGNGVAKPGNYLVPVGTTYKDLIEETVGGLVGTPARIISGGPMMGFSVNSLEFPITKASGGILIFNQDSPLATIPEESPCVRCGRCVDKCPMFLEPTIIYKAVKRRDWPAVAAANIASCVECGSCAYNCPAKLPLVQYIRMGKQFITTQGVGGRNPYYK